MAGLGCGALFPRFGEGRNDWLYILTHACNFFSASSRCCSQYFQRVKYRGFNCYVETLGLLLGVPANLLPIFPKHTQLQKSTLAIQMPTPMLSLLIKPS